MAEGDLSVALEVFRASLPRRGDKARDDRLFLEALHYFAVHNITWRTLPERFQTYHAAAVLAPIGTENPNVLHATLLSSPGQSGREGRAIP